MRKNETTSSVWIKLYIMGYGTTIVAESRRHQMLPLNVACEGDAAEVVEISVVGFTKEIVSPPSLRALFLLPIKPPWTPLTPLRKHSLKDDSGIHRGLIAFMGRMASAEEKFVKGVDITHL
jgi:hypothetical protein